MSVEEPGAQHLAPRVAWWISKCHGLGHYQLSLRAMLRIMCLHLEKLYLYQIWRRWNWFIMQMKHGLRRKIPFLLRAIHKIIFKYWKSLAFQKWKALVPVKDTSKLQVLCCAIPRPLLFTHQAIFKVLQRYFMKAALKKWLSFCVDGVNAEYALRSTVQRNLMSRALTNWRKALTLKLALLKMSKIWTRYCLRRAWNMWLYTPSALKLDASSWKTPIRREKDHVCDCIYRICTGDHCRCKLVTHAKLRLKTMGNYIEYAQAASQASEVVKQRSSVKVTPSKLTPANRITPASHSRDVSMISTASTQSRSRSLKASGRKPVSTKAKSSTATLSSVKAVYTPRKTATPSGRIEGHRNFDSSTGYMSMRTSLSLSEQSFDRSVTSASFSHWDLSPYKDMKQKRRD